MAAWTGRRNVYREPRCEPTFSAKRVAVGTKENRLDASMAIPHTLKNRCAACEAFFTVSKIALTTQ